jgi:predicted alpha/beta-fold hydrolase
MLESGAGVPVTSPRLYTAGHTDDLRQALIYISNKYPHAPLLGLGFSLGANLMTRYLGEEGDRSRLSSALVISCVSNLWPILPWLFVDLLIFVALGHGEEWL